MISNRVCCVVRLSRKKRKWQTYLRFVLFLFLFIVFLFDSKPVGSASNYLIRTKGKLSQTQQEKLLNKPLQQLS